MAFVKKFSTDTNADIEMNTHDRIQPQSAFKDHGKKISVPKINIKKECQLNDEAPAIKQEKNNEDSAFFEVEVNYLPNLNIVRFDGDEINHDENHKDSISEPEQGYHNDEEFSEREEQTIDNDDDSDDASASTSIINKISKEVFEKYKKLCAANDICLNVSSNNLALQDADQQSINGSDDASFQKEFFCEICENTFSDNASLAMHKLTHVDDNLFECDECDKKFGKYGSLRVHRERHHSADKRHKCDECDKQFARIGDLNQHKAMHDEIKKYNCGDCPKQFARSAGLRRHKLTHSGLKPHECEICLKRFSQSGDLKKHLMYHRGEKPYQCDICFKFFSQASNLNQHRKTHSGIRSFFCDVCFKVFQSNSNLKHHQLIHNAVKRYKCDVCHKNFIRGGDLKKHRIIHGGEKKFSCHLCQRPFLRNGDLKKHMAIHRDIVPQQRIELNNIKHEVPDWNEDDYEGSDPQLFSAQFPNIQLDMSRRLLREETQLSDLQDNVISKTISSMADVSKKMDDMELWNAQRISSLKDVQTIKIEAPDVNELSDA